MLIRNQKHLEFVRSKRCMTCFSLPQNHAHHLLTPNERGTGIKNGDNWAVPLCHKCHTDLHNTGSEIKYFESCGWDMQQVLNCAKELYKITVDAS